MSEKQTCIIICPDFKSYPKQPEDISLCTLEDCPDCNNKMWFSEKKKELKKFATTQNFNIIFCCYGCLLGRAMENPEIMKDATMVRI